MRPYMTEDEAKRRWCPMQKDRLKDEDGVMLPRYACIASGCLWWGWLERRGADLDNGVPNPYLDKKLGRCEAPGGAK